MAVLRQSASSSWLAGFPNKVLFFASAPRLSGNWTATQRAERAWPWWEDDMLPASSVAVGWLCPFLSPVKRVSGRIRSGNQLPWTHRTPGGLARNHLHILFFYYPVPQKRGAGVKRIPSEESGRRNVWGPKWRAFRAGSLLSVRLRVFQAMLARLLCKLAENSRPQHQRSLNLSKPS